MVRNAITSYTTESRLTIYLVRMTAIGYDVWDLQPTTITFALKV
jgi:hypothetical protein